MKMLVPKIIVFIFGLWIIFNFVTRSGRFNPLPNYPDGQPPIYNPIDFMIDASDIITIGTIDVGCDGQILAYDDSNDRFYWASDGGVGGKL